MLSDFRWSASKSWRAILSRSRNSSETFRK